MGKIKRSKTSVEVDQLMQSVLYTETGERRASADIERDATALHHYKLAKAVYTNIVEQEEAHFEVQIQQPENTSQQDLHESTDQRGHLHLGVKNMCEKQFENELEQGPELMNKSKVHGHREIITRGARKKKRHRISKKRFMTCIDSNLFQSVLLHSKLQNSPLWEDNFDVNKLSLENFITTRRDMLKMEVLIEGLKEGLFDKIGVGDPLIAPPTEEVLEAFEAGREEEVQNKKDQDTESILAFARNRAKQFGDKNDVSKAGAQAALKEAKGLLIKKEQERKLQDLMNGLQEEDAFTKLVKPLREPDVLQDEWSINESTTTGSYLSWRKVGKPKIGKVKRPAKPKKEEEFRTAATYLLRGIAALIIISYWVKYVCKAAEDAFYDIYSENLHASDVWMLRNYHDAQVYNWEFFFSRLYNWIHFSFTFISPLIVYKNSTSLGILYGFSTLIDASIHMFSKGHDFVYESKHMSGDTWELVAEYGLQAVGYSILFTFFLIYHYVADNHVKIEREFSHRKNRRLNRIVYAKSLGNFEQRMLAWDWMVNRARLQALKKLAREYPEVTKVHGHYPVPEKDEVKFDLRKQLRLFRLRHCFYDINMKGGWVNMEKYQESLFGSFESSDEEPIDVNAKKWKAEAYVAGHHNKDKKEHETLEENAETVEGQKRGTIDSQRSHGVEGEEVKLDQAEKRGTFGSQGSAKKRDTLDDQKQSVGVIINDKNKSMTVELNKEKRATVESVHGKRVTVETQRNRPTATKPQKYTQDQQTLQSKDNKRTSGDKDKPN